MSTGSGNRTARQEEELHVQKRNAELRKQEHWTSVAEYFKTWDVKTSKYASWTSDQYFQQSIEARVEAETKERQKQLLEERKGKLKQVLEAEQKIYENDVKSKSRGQSSSHISLEELKEFDRKIKLMRKEAHKEEAELKLYQKWKQEQPTLRDLERRKHVEFLKKSWAEQAKEKDELRKKQQAEEALRAKEEEIKQKEEEELEKFRQKRKEEKLAQLKEEINKQLEEIDRCMKKCKELEAQEANERKVQLEIEEMIIQRKLAEQKHANRQLSAFWTRQYQLKLQQKAKEVEEEIIHDQEMLKRIDEEYSRDIQAKAQAKEIARKEMELALKELHTYRERELLRQKEYEQMFFEEAKRAWEIQEKKWAQERQARDLLMREVLDTMKKQLDEKIQRNCTKRAEALADREKLLIGINKLYDECSEREMEMKLAKKQYRKDLDDQITKKTVEKARKVREEAELEGKMKQKELEDERKHNEELEKVERRRELYKPPDFRRRRVVW